MTTPPRLQQNGFTLVELLVALFIFSLIAVAGVGLLRTSVDGQLALKEKLSVVALSSRTANLLEADLAQAVARPTRDQRGSAVGVFTTDLPETSGTLFSFVRNGAEPADGTPQSGLARVAYSFANGQLRRTSWPMLDGSSPAAPSVLANKLRSVVARFRQDNGKWRDDWTAEDPLALPRAVELRITPTDGAEYRLVMLVGSQNRVKPKVDAEGDDAA